MPVNCEIKATVAGATFRGLALLNGKIFLDDQASSKVYACDYNSATAAVGGCAPLSPQPTGPLLPWYVAAAAV